MRTARNVNLRELPTNDHPLKKLGIFTVKYLKEKNIGSRVMYPPLNEQPAYSIPGLHPISKNVGQNGLWLPSMSQLTDDEVHYICDAIIEFYGSK